MNSWFRSFVCSFVRLVCWQYTLLCRWLLFFSFFFFTSYTISIASSVAFRLSSSFIISKCYLRQQPHQQNNNHWSMVTQYETFRAFIYSLFVFFFSTFLLIVHYCRFCCCCCLHYYNFRYIR